MRTNNTHEKGALFGYDGVNTWVEQTFAPVPTVTLDGRPATITGYQNKFATIRSVDGKLSGEWSWAAVDLVIDKHDGKFTL